MAAHREGGADRAWQTDLNGSAGLAGTCCGTVELDCSLSDILLSHLSLLTLTLHQDCVSYL